MAQHLAPSSAPASPPSVPASISSCVGDLSHPFDPEPWSPEALPPNLRAMAVQSAGQFAAWLQPTSDVWIAKQLRVLAEVLGAESTDADAWAARNAVYCAALRSYPQDLLARAFTEGVRIWKWFPKPAEIIELVREDHARRGLAKRRLERLAGQAAKPAFVPVNDTPEQREETACGLKNLRRWQEIVPQGWTGIWPQAGDLTTDSAFSDFLARPELAGVTQPHPPRG